MSFREFYPFYLSQHQNSVCRGLHVFGSLLVLTSLIFILWKRAFLFLPLLLLFGYGPAWIGHFFFEKNKPATFQYPLYSFVADWVMVYQSFRHPREGGDPPVPMRFPPSRE